MINFDDIYEEEFDNDLNNIHIKPGDILLPNQYVTYWKYNKWVSYWFNYINSNNIIDKIELSNNIIGNPYGRYNDKFKKIPDSEIVFSIKGHWPWYKYDQNLKIKFTPI